MRRFIVIITLLIPQIAFAEDFEVSKILARYDLSLFDLERMPNRQFFTNRYFVGLSEGGLNVSREEKKTNKSYIKFEDIEYLGTNNGEWGGKLEVRINGELKELMKGNIVHLLPLEGKLYVIEGLAHLGMSRGSLSVIDDITQPTSPRLITRLPDAPKQVYLDNTRSDYQRIVIVGSRGIMSLGPYLNPEILYWDTFWGFYLEPTSIVRFQDYYFIGLPHGVATVPAPWGVSSRYCRNNCREVQFYTDQKFNKLINATPGGARH